MFPYIFIEHFVIISNLDMFINAGAKDLLWKISEDWSYPLINKGKLSVGRVSKKKWSKVT